MDFKPPMVHMFCEECRKNPMAAGASITAYKCPRCKKDKWSGSTFIPKMCRECAIELRLCQRCEADMTIESI